MFEIHLGAQRLEIVRRHFRMTLPHVGLSHRDEAMARGLGFRSLAALKSEISSYGRMTCEVHERAAASFLRERGYRIPDGRSRYVSEALALAFNKVLPDEGQFGGEEFAFSMRFTFARRAMAWTTSHPFPHTSFLEWVRLPHHRASLGWHWYALRRLRDEPGGAAGLRGLLEAEVRLDRTFGDELLSISKWDEPDPEGFADNILIFAARKERYADLSVRLDALDEALDLIAGEAWYSFLSWRRMSSEETDVFRKAFLFSRPDDSPFGLASWLPGGMPWRVMHPKDICFQQDDRVSPSNVRLFRVSRRFSRDGLVGCTRPQIRDVGFEIAAPVPAGWNGRLPVLFSPWVHPSLLGNVKFFVEEGESEEVTIGEIMMKRDRSFSEWLTSASKGYGQ